MTLLLQFYIARSYWNSDKPSHSSSALLQTFSAINFSWHLQIPCKILRFISWLILLALLYITLSYKILYSLAMASLKAETCSCFYVPCIYWSCSTYVLLYDPNLPRICLLLFMLIRIPPSVTKLSEQVWMNLFRPCSHEMPPKNGRFMRKDRRRYSKSQTVARPHCSHRQSPIQPTAHCTECVGVVPFTTGRYGVRSNLLCCSVFHSMTWLLLGWMTIVGVK